MRTYQMPFDGVAYTVNKSVVAVCEPLRNFGTTKKAVAKQSQTIERLHIW